MPEQMNGELLLYAGLALLIAGAIACVVAVAALWLYHRRLKNQLTDEYGAPERY